MPMLRRWAEQLKQVGAVPGGTGSWDNFSATVGSDAITIGNPGIYTITGEGGVADDLATINGGLTGYEVMLHRTTATITVKHGTGNIHIGADFRLDNDYDMLRLIKRADGKWVGGGLGDNA